MRHFATALAILAALTGCAREPEAVVAPGAAPVGATIVVPPDAPPTTVGALPSLLPRGGSLGTPLGGRPAPPPLRSQIFPGSGVVLGPPRADPPPRTAGARTLAGGDVELSFVGAEIRDVARVILADILSLDFIVDPGVQGTLTLETSQPIPRAAVLQTFEAVLRLSGYALAQRGANLYAVVATPVASRTGVLARGGAGFGTEVVVPRFVGVTQLRRLLEPILRENQLAQVDPSRNVLLITGTEAERRAVRETVAQFDVDWMRGMSFALFAARHANARRLVEDLTALLGGEGSPTAGLVRLVAIERLNAVLAISPQPRYLQQLQVWAERLDRETAGDERRVFVYYVQNGRANDLARVLTRAFGGGGGTDSGAPGRFGTTPGGGLFGGGGGGGGLFGGSVPGAGGRGGGGFGGGGGGFGGGGFGGGGPGGGGFGNPLSTPLQSDASPTQDASPFGGAPSGGVPPPATPGTPGGGANQPGGPGAPISITNDETNNALVIVATPRQYETVEAALRRLDVLPLQVLIEAAVTEITLTNDLRFGLQWALGSGQSRGVLNNRSVDPSATTTTSGSAAVNALRGALLPSVADASVPVPIFPNFSYIYSAPNITVVLEALDQITTVNVLSAPQILVLNNQTASLQVGDQVPVQTQSAQSVSTAGAPIVSSLEYRDTGVILRVTPRVNESGLVLLDIAQEVSAVVPASSNTNAAQASPTIQQRRLASTIAVQDGQTIALGGLIRDGRNQSRGGVPVLSDIPYLGYLFGRTRTAADRTELLVLLTPRVIRTQNDAQTVTDELRARIRTLVPIPPPPIPTNPGPGRPLPRARF